MLISSELDGAFNLTNTYRRDSDIVRHYGEIENSIANDDPERIFQKVMSQKQPYGVPLDKEWVTPIIGKQLKVIR